MVFFSTAEWPDQRWERVSFEVKHEKKTKILEPILVIGACLFFFFFFSGEVRGPSLKVATRCRRSYTRQTSSSGRENGQGEQMNNTYTNYSDNLDA